MMDRLKLTSPQASTRQDPVNVCQDSFIPCVMDNVLPAMKFSESNHFIGEQKHSECIRE